MTLSQNSYLLRNFPAIDLHFLSKYAVFYNNLSKMLFCENANKNYAENENKLFVCIISRNCSARFSVQTHRNTQRK